MIPWPRGLLLLLLGVLALAAASPYLLGRYVGNQLLRASSPAVQIEPDNRGWLESKFAGRWHIQDIDFTLRHELQHGPVLLDRMQFAPASLHTVLPHAECSRLGFECDAPPPTLNSVFDWHGNSSHTAHIAELKAPRWSVQELKATLRLPPEMLEWQPAIRLHGVVIALQLTAKQLRYVPLALDALSTDLQLTSDDGLWNARLENHIQTLRWQDHAWQDLNIMLHTERLDAEILQNTFSQDWSAKRLLALHRWLTQNPTLVLENITLDNAKLHTTGHIQLRAVKLWQILRRPNLIGLGRAVLASAELQLRAERAMAEQLLALWLHSDLTDETLQEARQQLQEWVKAGFVRLQNNHYHAHLSFENNQFISH